VSQKTSQFWQAVASTLLLTLFAFKQLWRKWCDLKQLHIVYHKMSLMKCSRV